MSVLVLEAGNDLSGDINVIAPGLFTAMYGDPYYDWDYKTTPQASSSVTIRCLFFLFFLGCLPFAWLDVADAFANGGLCQ